MAEEKESEVDEENDSSQRDKGIVRGTAIMDMILSLFKLGFFLVGIIRFFVIFDVPNGPFSKFVVLLISVGIWVIVFGVTALQLRDAYKLFLVTYQDALGPSVSLKRSQQWLRTAIFVYVLIILQVIYFLVRRNPAHFLVWVLCILEFVFRTFGMYFVREFGDDLKHQVAGLRRSSSVKYNNAAVPPQITIIGEPFTTAISVEAIDADAPSDAQESTNQSKKQNRSNCSSRSSSRMGEEKV